MEIKLKHWINKAHIAAHTHASALKYGTAVAIILGGLLYRNPTLACTLILSTAICMYVLTTTRKRLRFEGRQHGCSRRSFDHADDAAFA
ncbi:hypothetical protein ACTMU2_14465 [Cupriavidus basilensis]